MGAKGLSPVLPNFIEGTEDTLIFAFLSTQKCTLDSKACTLDTKVALATTASNIFCSNDGANMHPMLQMKVFHQHKNCQNRKLLLFNGVAREEQGNVPLQFSSTSPFTLSQA